MLKSKGLKYFRRPFLAKKTADMDFLTSSPRVNEAELKGFVGYGFFHFLKK